MPKQISESELITALKTTGGHRAEAANLLGISERGLYSRLSRIDDSKIPSPTPRGVVKGTSTLYDAQTGEAKLIWVKEAREKAEKALEVATKAACERIKRADPAPMPKAVNDDLLNLYVITDYHLGVLCWGEECGEDWDTKQAEELLVKWFAEAIRLSPKAHTAILGQLGDFLHIDGLLPVTPASAHVLDADTRFQKLVRIAIRALRRVIHMLLKNHEHVHIIMADANHDESSSAWMREMFYALYEDEPRITVDRNADTYYVHEWGDTSLFFHHGHKKRPSNIDDVFVGKYREVFGRTRHSYAHMGHLHHIEVKETNLMVVEQHRTLAATDAYAARGGWLSGRSAPVITYHKRYGEVARNTISPQMLADV